MRFRVQTQGDSWYLGLDLREVPFREVMKILWTILRYRTVEFAGTGAVVDRSVKQTQPGALA